MTRDDQATDPADVGPGLKLETRTSEEYRAPEEALEALNDADLPPQDDRWRVLGNLLAVNLQERFQNRTGVEQPAATACIRRLITGDDECSCSPARCRLE